MWARPSRSRCSRLRPAVKVWPLADLVERAARAIGDAAVQLAVRVAVEGAARRIRRVLGDAGHLERLAVVERRVAAAMMHHDRMILRHLVEVVHVQLALVLHLGVVEEIALDPGARRRLLRLRAQLVDDAVDGDELDLEGIADEHVVEQHRAGRVIVAVDEPGTTIICLASKVCVFAGQPLDVGGAADGEEAAGLHRERLGPRHPCIDGVDLGVEDDEIGLRRIVRCRASRLHRRGCRVRAQPGCRRQSGKASGGSSDEFSA